MRMPRDRGRHLRRYWSSLCCAALAVALVGPARAQTGLVGVGAQIGAPGGLTGRFLLRAPGSQAPGFGAVIVQASFNLSGYLLLQTHLTRDLPIPESPVELFLGPGLVGGTDETDPVIGVGAILGARFYRGRFEVHMQLSPRLHLRPDLNGLMGAGVGLRYFP